MTGPSTPLAVVVLNWNNAPDTIECLQSLASSTVPLDVLVVDNGSQDDSVSRITDIGLHALLLQTGANLGYAGGNNAGVAHALAAGYEYIAVLNNDTTAEPATWQTLLDHGRECARAGRRVALSPRTLYADGTDTVWFAGGVWDRGWPRHLQAAELPTDGPTLQPTPILSGCCIVAHRGVWEEVGPFDAGFFLIFEDTDWSARADRLGVELLVAQDARLRHKVSRSFAVSATSKISGFYYARNGLRCVWRHRRRRLVSFATRQVLRQSIHDARTGSQPSSMSLLLGLGAFFVGHRGPAPTWLARLSRQVRSTR